MTNRHCRHIKTNGLHCGSFALPATDFCYQHYRLLKRRRKLTAPPAGIPASVQADTQIPDLELFPVHDAESMQINLSRVIMDLAAGRMTNRRAEKILYALHQAANNLEKL